MHMIFSSVPSSLGVGKVRGEKRSPAEGGKGKSWRHPRFPFQAWAGRAGQKTARAPGHTFSSNSSGVLVFRDLPQWPPSG